MTEVAVCPLGVDTRRLVRIGIRRLFRHQREDQVHSFVADRVKYWWNVSRPDAPVLWDSTIQLGEQFFNEIILHPVPLDMNTLRALKRSPLGLDLYLWLVYRTFSLKTPLCLSWRQLFKQFGADPGGCPTDC